MRGAQESLVLTVIVGMRAMKVVDEKGRDKSGEGASAQAATCRRPVTLQRKHTPSTGMQPLPVPRRETGRSRSLLAVKVVDKGQMILVWLSDELGGSPPILCCGWTVIQQSYTTT